MLCSRYILKDYIPVSIEQVEVSTETASSTDDEDDEDDSGFDTNLLMIVIAAAALLLFCLIAFGAKRGQKDDEKLQEFDLGSMSGYSMQSVGSVQDVGSEYAVQIPMSYSGAMMNY